MSSQRTRRRAPTPASHVRSSAAPEVPRTLVREQRTEAGYVARLLHSYLPGAIVRVACSHFVTYDAVEFFPGPYLNMIIGPNGTGKSTIVCAIALGLGWKPSVLGRAKDVASYVKLGHKQGWVEVELQGAPAQPNVVVRRIMFRESNTSDWLLNGVAATARDVHDAVSEFQVEVGNLCAFLPQDRVADFAAMTPRQLLQDTQHAAGHAQLSAWHAELIAQGKELAQARERLEVMQREHDHLEERNAVAERDVRRYEERIELERHVAALEVRVALAEFRDAKDRYDEARAAREDAKAALTQLLREREPLEHARDAAQQKADKIELQQSERRRDADEALGALKRLTTSREQLDADLAELGHQERRLDTLDAERKKALDELRVKLAELEEQLADGPPPSAGDVDQRLRAVKAQHRSASDDVRDLDAQLSETRIRHRHVEHQASETRQTLDRWKTVRYQRLQILARADRDTYEAVQWLESHQGLFEKQVYEPVLAVVQVSRPEAARAIETCLSWAVQRTFVCQTRADYDLFTRELIDKRKWRLNVVEMEGGPALDTYAPPLPPGALERLGFDAYLLQCIDAPHDVLRYLCSASSLHAIPVAFHGRVDPAALEQQRAIRRFVVDDTIFSTSYSQYGKRLPQTMSRVLKPLRNFAHVGHDRERERAAATLEALEAELRSIHAQQTQLQAQRDEKQAELQTLAQKRAELTSEFQTITEARQAHERRQARRDATLARIQDEEARPSVSVQRRQLATRRQQIALELARVAERTHRSLVALTRANEAGDRVSLQAMHASYLCDEARGALDAFRSRVEESERGVRDAVATFAEVKAHTLNSKRRADQRLEEAPGEIQERVRAELENGDETTAHLTALLERAQAQLNVPWGIGASVVETFRARAAQISELKRSIETSKIEVRQLEGAMSRIHALWRPALDELIAQVNARFSASFERLGCAGEVRLAPDDDYDRWGIEIWVKFRETERLQLLTGQRQSGGERSLSTILYLLSLTELARSPFSLVDEINQGMDPRAERAVHNQMVERTCRPDAGQYFLITPKLLPGLEYHDLMKVLIVYNGDWLPDTLRRTYAV